MLWHESLTTYISLAHKHKGGGRQGGKGREEEWEAHPKCGWQLLVAAQIEGH